MPYNTAIRMWQLNTPFERYWTDTYVFQKDKRCMDEWPPVPCGTTIGISRSYMWQHHTCSTILPCFNDTPDQNLVGSSHRNYSARLLMKPSCLRLNHLTLSEFLIPNVNFSQFRCMFPATFAKDSYDWPDYKHFIDDHSDWSILLRVKTN